MTALSKILRPKIDGYCPRPRLAARLDHQSTANWLTSPAGSGKTCLISGFVSESKRPCLWLHLDADDQEPATFFHYLTLAAERAGARVADPKLSPEYRGALSTFSRRYFRSLFATLPAQTIVVLDNYESLEQECELHACVAAGIRETTLGSSWAILSRRAAHGPFVVLEAERRLIELAWEDLRFTESEALALLLRHLPEAEAQAFLETVYPDNQGWVAGLLLTLGAGASGGGKLRARSESGVFDYFAEEIFSRVEPDARDVLLRAACLPEFSAEDVELVTERPRALEVIEDQANRGYFTFRLAAPGLLASRRRRYRFHPLYRDFLLAKAHQEISRSEWQALLGRAAQRLGDKGLPEQAITLLLEVGHWREIERLIRAYGPDLLEAGRHDLLRTWLERVPSDLPPEPRGWLSYWHACARLPFDPTQANRLFSTAYACFEETGDSEGLFLSWASGVESLLYGWGTYRDFDPWLETYDRVLARLSAPTLTIQARVACARYGALTFRRPHDPRLQALERSIRRFGFMSRVIDPHQYVLLCVIVVHHDLWRGNVARAGAMLKSLSGTVRSTRVGPVAALAYYAVRALFGHFTGDGRASLEASGEGLALARERGVHFWDFLLLAQGAYGALVEDQRELAHGHLEKMSEQVHPERHMENMAYYDAMAQAALREERVPDALGYSELAVEHVVRLGCPFLEAIVRIGSSQVHFVAQQLERAREELDRAEAIVRRAGSKILLARVHFARAEYALERPLAPRDAEAVSHHLGEGFRLCRENAYLGFPWWRAEVVGRLCAEALRLDIEAEFVRAFILKRRLLPPRGILPMAWPSEVRIVTLGNAFQVWVGDELIRFTGKAQKRPLELLQALIALGGVDVSIETLAERLWPDSDGDAAQQSVSTTLHRLRRLIGAEVIVRVGGMLSLDPQRCRVDCFDCERMIDGIDAPKRQGSATAEPLLALYRGPFLAGSQADWALDYRARLRRRFVGRVVFEMEAAARRDDPAAATEWGERAIEVEPAAEALYQALITNLKSRGMGARAADTYRRCRESLRAHHDSVPSSETERAFRGLYSLPA